MTEPFRRVVDDLTQGCGCACHFGTGYRSSCEHCRPTAPSQPLTVQERAVVKAAVAWWESDWEGQRQADDTLARAVDALLTAREP